MSDSSLAPSELDRAARADAIAGVPWEAFEYERWIAERREQRDDYLFAEAKVRFDPRDEDRLRALPDLKVAEARGEVTLRSDALGGGVAVQGVKRAVAERLLSSIDGKRTLAELRVAAAGDRAALERLVAAGIGRVLFVPEAVSALERLVSGVELVRFVGTPYEIVREHWVNAAFVRAEASRELDQARDAVSFLRLLRRLHVFLLMGEDLQSFYRPASRITRGGVRPGALYDTPTKIVRGDRGALILSGPRVSVSLMGGARYHRLLYESAGDPDALGTERRCTDDAGLAWGELLTGRAVEDAADTAWFCPSRPLTAAHMAALHTPVRAALEASRSDDVVAELARFHWRFVRLHPFRCANQSLAMSLVNVVLTRSRGAGIPHLLLDQLALRLDERSYGRAFALAVEAHTVTGSAEERWSALRAKKLRSYALIEQLQRARTDEEGEALVRADPEAARCALIRVAPTSHVE